MKSPLTEWRHLPLSLPKVAFLACTAACVFFACSNGNDVAGGPGSITTNGIVASAGGVPVPNARVSLRHVDYAASTADEELLIVGVADAMTDSVGRFNLDVPEEGEFRLTVAHDGIAFSKIVNHRSYSLLDSVGSVALEATATVTGVADVPAGSKSIWVGVLGTDVLVKSDSNGVFVIPSIPANDSLQLYFKDESYSEELERKSVYLAPYQQVLYNYKASDTKDTVDVPKDSVDTPADTLRRVVTLLPNGKPAAYATVALRKSDAVAKKRSVRNAMVVADLYADGNGLFNMEWPDSGEYRLTVSSGSLSYSAIYSADELSSLDTLRLSPSVQFSSNVSLKSGEEFAWVGVYGLDELVKTDASGNYVLPVLPAKDSLDVYFVYNDSVSSFATLPIRTSDEASSFKPSVFLYDFEEENPNWYMSVDTLWKGSTFKTNDGKNDSTHLVKDHLQMDLSRESKVFHAKYRVAFDPYAWVLLGTQLKETLNLSALDSIEFYAKGNGNVRLALENWENYDNGVKAASRWMALDSNWRRFVIQPSELCFDGDEKENCETAWDAVKDQVKQIHIFPSSGSEFFVDDIKLYGVLF